MRGRGEEDQVVEKRGGDCRMLGEGWAREDGGGMRGRGDEGEVMGEKRRPGFFFFLCVCV